MAISTGKFVWTVRDPTFDVKKLRVAGSTFFEFRWTKRERGGGQIEVEVRAPLCDDDAMKAWIRVDVRKGDGSIWRPRGGGSEEGNFHVFRGKQMAEFPEDCSREKYSIFYGEWEDDSNNYDDPKYVETLFTDDDLKRSPDLVAGGRLALEVTIKVLDPVPTEDDDGDDDVEEVPPDSTGKEEEGKRGGLPGGGRLWKRREETGDVTIR